MRRRRNPFTGKMQDYPPPQTILCPPTGRPTRESISQTFGFRVPLPYVELVQWIYGRAKGGPYKCVELFGKCFGIGVENGSTIYAGIPPEIRTIGLPGVDGVHFGFLVHAPELEQEDYPIAHICAMDSDGVSIEGAGTLSGLASIACFWRGDPGLIKIPAWQAAVARVPARDFREPAPPPLPVRDAIVIPDGWRFEPSNDGVGVLAPAELFGKTKLVTVKPHADEVVFLKPAEAAMKKGHWAAALLYLRDGYWSNWTSNPQRLCERLCEVYQQLNRPVFASVIAERMQKWQTQDEAGTA